MRKSRLFVLVAMALAAAVVPSIPRSGRAEPDAADPDAARRARIAVTVGTRKVTVGELEDQIATIPSYQMSMFGGTRDAVTRAYLDQVLARDMILASGAEQRGHAKQLPTKQLLERALSSATLRKTRSSYPSAAAIPIDDVKKYYEENKSRFDSPERINLWRILCKTKEEANTTLDAARREPTIAKYNDLARDRSIDKATNLRGGNLGFVAPDGSSNEAGVKVDPALVKAAQSVKDGELVSAPVPEGAAWAVVWRRGTVPPNRRTVEEASPQIRAALFRERTESAEKKLIDELRAKNVKEINPGLLGVIELRPFDAGLGLPRNPVGASSSARTPDRTRDR